MPTVILISGVPATWKSSYCRWLGQQKGFLHLDFDKLLRGQGSIEKLSFVQVLQTAGVEAFIATAQRNGNTVVIDWGFPPNNLPAVRELQAAGVEVWWFEGERQIARQKFIERGGVDPRCFDVQMDAIEANWLEISRVFGPHAIETLHSDGTYTEPEEIFNRMFPPQKI
ncbi:MAG: hypothetical protein ABSA41_11970 [Terriglobia bacterium]|jgi:hypothetical protein